MRARALEDGGARPAAIVPRAEHPSAPVPARVYAGVLERDGKGIPTQLFLPGPLAERQVSLYVQGRWAGMVIDSGRICHDFKRGYSPDKQELARIRPGTKIVCSCDLSGRVLALGALPTPAKDATWVSQRFNTISRRRENLSWAHHDPNEILIHGGGRVLRVT